MDVDASISINIYISGKHAPKLALPANLVQNMAACCIHSSQRHENIRFPPCWLFLLSLDKDSFFPFLTQSPYRVVVEKCTRL